MATGTEVGSYEGAEDSELVRAMCTGSEDAFCALVRRHQPSLWRLARVYTRNDGLADEVVQETWLCLLSAMESFAHRSSVKTWICGILINVARARMRKEQRTVPMSALEPGVTEVDDGPAVDPSRFLPEDHHWGGNWAAPPTAFPGPETVLLTTELRRVLLEHIERLVEAQREVLVLRDVEGFSAEEVCATLGLSEANQRVLLHRARAKMRTSLERHFAEAVPS